MPEKKESPVDLEPRIAELERRTSLSANAEAVSHKFDETDDLCSVRNEQMSDAALMMSLRLVRLERKVDKIDRVVFGMVQELSRRVSALEDALVKSQE